MVDQLVTSGIIASTDITTPVSAELVGLPPSVMTSISTEVAGSY